MKIKDATEKANEALDGVAAKVERTRLTKWVLVALAVVVVLLLAAWFTKARATGMEHAIVPVVVKTAPVVPPVVVPPPVSVPVPPPSSGAAPVQPSGGGNGPGAMGWYVMGGVIVFFVAVICTAERHKNPQGWFAKNCRPQDWVKPQT